MKKIIIALSLMFTLNAIADIEHEPGQEINVIKEEINKNRSCFQELTVQGCGGPGEDPNHFRSCLKNVHSSLSKDCKNLMSDLYGN